MSISVTVYFCDQEIKTFFAETAKIRNWFGSRTLSLTGVLGQAPRKVTQKMSISLGKNDTVVISQDETAAS